MSSNKRSDAELTLGSLRIAQVDRDALECRAYGGLL
jgi:hypothetical protein